MPRLQIPIAGTTYQSRSSPVANQLTQNFYIEVSQTENPASLQSFPGLTLFANTGGGDHRGMGTWNGTVYKVTGSTLYSISSAGAVTSIGTIYGSGRCQLQDAINDLVIANSSGKPYQYDGTLTQGTNANLPNASTVTYINNRVVYDGVNADVVFADLGNPITAQAANVTADDVTPDDVLAVYTYKQQLFSFGERSITPYYNSGAGSPPYSVIQNSVQRVGLGAIYSIASNNTAMFFLGHDLRVYAVSGLTAQPIDDQSIGDAIRGYADPSEAIGMCFSFNGQNFYMLTFPTYGSWLYNERVGWTSLAYKVNEPHLIGDYVYAYNKHLVADRRNGNVYQLDFDNFTDNGENILRVRTTSKVSGKEIGAPGHLITMNELELVMESGPVGSGTPQVLMSFSDDGGHTWSPEEPANIGQTGDFTAKQLWFDLGEFYERQFRFSVSSPVKVTFISCNARVEVGSG